MQLNYNSVSRPLHARLKAHTETLYNKGLIINSSFSLIFILFAGIRQKKMVDHYTCAATIVNLTERPFQIDTLYRKYKMR